MTAGELDSALLGRIVRPADYVRVLATTLRLRSPHFAVHHLDGKPLPLRRPMTPAEGGGDTGRAPVATNLSTELSTYLPGAPTADVDDSQVSDPIGAVETPISAGGIDRWLGLVVPKRHAKRAVTRTLIKRQIRNVAAACAPQLEPGLWVVRQRSSFDPTQFPSAASDALKEAARTELRALFDRAVRGERDRVKPRPPGEHAAKGRGGRSVKTKTSGAAPPAEGRSCAA